MHSEIASALSTRGFVTRPQLLDCGYDDRAIQNVRNLGILVRIGPGLYAGAGYAELSPEAQHRLRCRAVATRFDGRIVFSHQSAAVLHEIAVWGLPLDYLQVTRLDDGRGRKQANVVHHVSDLADDEITEIDGLLVVTPGRCVWDVAVRGPREPALVIADSALHLGLTSEDELVAISRRHRHWRGAGKARITLTLADPAAESPGETRSRYLFREAGLPTPIAQFEIFAEDGSHLATVDFAWPEFRHLAEFDGLKKYSSANDLAREDRVRRLAWGLSRIVWSQLSPGQRRLLARDLLDAMKQSLRLYGPAVA